MEQQARYSDEIVKSKGNTSQGQLKRAMDQLEIQSGSDLLLKAILLAILTSFEMVVLVDLLDKGILRLRKYPTSTTRSDINRMLLNLVLS